MQKIKFNTCFYCTVLFFCSKGCQIKFKTLFDYENQQQKGIQNIAINYSADIDYKDFLKICRECTREPFNFLTIDTTLPASYPLRFSKKFSWFLIKMTVTDQLKILDRYKCKRRTV